MSSYQNHCILRSNNQTKSSKVACLSLVIAALAGCGNKPPACGDEQNMTVVKQIFNDELAASNVQPSQDTGWLDKFKQASKTEFSTIRTTGLDEKIGKVSCAATMVTTFPEGAKNLLANTMLPDAFKKDYPGLNMKVNGLALSTDIEYSSQMTDDKKNLLVEVKGLQGVVEIASVAGRTGLFLVKPAPNTSTVAAAGEIPSTSAPQATQSTQAATDGTGATELSRYAGKSAASLMADAGVSVKLNQLLGKDYAAFKERMDVSGDVGQDAGYLWATGNMPHEGGSEVAGFAVNSKTGDAVAVVLVGGKQYKFYGVNKAGDLPTPLLEWYKQRNETQ
jgi:hypothetical protein